MDNEKRTHKKECFTKTYTCNMRKHYLKTLRHMQLHVLAELSVFHSQWPLCNDNRHGQILQTYHPAMHKYCTVTMTRRC